MTKIQSETASGVAPYSYGSILSSSSSNSSKNYDKQSRSTAAAFDAEEQAKSGEGRHSAGFWRVLGVVGVFVLFAAASSTVTSKLTAGRLQRQDPIQRRQGSGNELFEFEVGQVALRTNSY